MFYQALFLTLLLPLPVPSKVLPDGSVVKINRTVVSDGGDDGNGNTFFFHSTSVTSHSSSSSSETTNSGTDSEEEEEKEKSPTTEEEEGVIVPSLEENFDGEDGEGELDVTVGSAEEGRAALGQD